MILLPKSVENPDEEISNNEAIDIANAMLNKYGYSILGSETITEHKGNLQKSRRSSINFKGL